MVIVSGRMHNRASVDVVGWASPTIRASAVVGGGQCPPYPSLGNVTRRRVGIAHQQALEQSCSRGHYRTTCATDGSRNVTINNI